MINNYLIVVISAIVGAIVGASSKLIFETIIPIRYRQKLTNRKLIKTYRYPLLRAADSLDRRIENMIRFIDRKWYEDDNEDYYRISTLYLFGCYFGWCKVFEDYAYLELESSDKKASNFSIRFNTVFKGLTGFEYFQNVPKGEIDDVEPTRVPRLALTAIGELMINQKTERQDDLPCMLSFIEFDHQIKTSTDFKKWFLFLEKAILLNHQPSKSSARWNSLLLFASTLRAFVIFLDPNSRQTSARSITYLNRLHPEVAKELYDELKERKMESFVINYPITN